MRMQPRPPFITTLIELFREVRKFIKRGRK